MSHKIRKSTIFTFSRRLLVAVMSLSLVACGAEDGEAPGDNAGTCFSSADCSGAMVCVSAGTGPGGCVPQCEVGAGECGGRASCQGIGAVSVDICQPQPSPEAPPKAEEAPQLVCESDEDCAALQQGAICAEWNGIKSCTIRCEAESACNVQGFQALGVTITTDFLACLPDESNSDRSACVPDESCFDAATGGGTVPCVSVDVDGF